MSATKRILRRVSIAAGLLVFTLVYAEGFVRIFDPQPLMPRYVTGTAYGIRGNIPNAHYWHSTPETPHVEFRINSLGMRDTREFPFEKAAGTCRVALYGDSFFMGYELAYEDTFASRLEGRLRSAGFNAEVLNFAVSGFGTAEMIRSYQSLGHRFDPDIVIFQWHSTDPDDNLRADLFRLEDGKPVATNRAYLPSIATQDFLMQWKVYRLLADHSHLYSFIREGLGKFTKRLLVSLKEDAGISIDANAAEMPVNGAAPDSIPISAQPSPAAVLSAALLRYAKGMVEESGSSFFVVEIPIQESRTAYTSSIAVLPQHDIAGVDVISPLEAFRTLASPDLKLFFERGQGHITPIAVNALVGVVAPRLTSSPNLQNCAPKQQASQNVRPLDLPTLAD